jgi:hypothetical protein
LFLPVAYRLSVFFEKSNGRHNLHAS